MQDTIIILKLAPQVVVVKLNALYSVDTGTFILTDENGNIITDDTDTQITGS